MLQGEMTDMERKARAKAREVRMLSKLGEYTVEELRKAIDRTTLENKAAIKSSISARVYPDKVQIVSEHPAFYLDMGVKPHQMRYVGNRVVPFELSDITRPTQKDRRQGVAFRVVHNPQHPGSKPLKFVEKAVEEAENRFAIYLLKEIMG